ncbi:MAG: NUDIX domain-containing protein [Parcubacteria group bacterium]|jgi:8-oxo-dGTP diphosphatase
MITKKYKFAVIAVDVVIFTIIDNELQVLLIKMKKKPFEKYWAAPGGLVGPEESTNDAAKRILLEKTGLGDVYLEQLYTFGEVDRDPFGRVVSVAYFALIPWGNLDLKTTEEYAGVQWFPISKFPALAYDHAEIIATAIGRLKAKLEYTNIAYGLLSETFALSELQNIYQIILQKKLDKRNFRKRILSLGIVKKSGKQRKGLPSRPADLYTFTQKKASMIQIL